MSEYELTKEKILAIVKECPQAEKPLKAAFPEAFKEKWTVVDPSRISVRVSREEGTIFLIQVDGEDIAWICNQRLELLFRSATNYRISTMNEVGEWRGSSINFIYEKK